MSAQGLAGRVQERSPLNPFVQGLMGAVAFGALTSSGGGTVNGAVSVAIGMGIAAAVFAVAGDWLARLASWFYSLLGLIAFIPGVVAFVRSNGCLPGPPPVLRFAGASLLAAIVLLMFALSFFTTRERPAPAVGLALFAALQILIAAGTFIVGSGESAGNLLALAAIMLLGWLVVKIPDAVAAVGGVAFGMQSIYTAAEPACGEANYSGAVLILVFCGAYFATRAVCAPFQGRR